VQGGEEHARELEALRRERAELQQREEQARSRCEAAHAEALALRAELEDLRKQHDSYLLSISSKQHELVQLVAQTRAVRGQEKSDGDSGSDDLRAQLSAGTFVLVTQAHFLYFCTCSSRQAGCGAASFSACVVGCP
jgi:hypothetical protein